MIDSGILKTLKLIESKLRGSGVRWVLAGSVSLALQGVNVKPNDIDILTDKEGALEINRILKDYEVKPIRFCRSELFQSYLGEFEIEGVKVEVMGDLKEFIEGEWRSLSHRLFMPRIVDVEGVRLPVSPLEDQLRSYQALGREIYQKFKESRFMWEGIVANIIIMSMDRESF